VPWAPARGLLFPSRVAALVSRPQSNEVIAVLEDGTAVRMPRP
jgi:hypothetical protein